VRPRSEVFCTHVYNSQTQTLLSTRAYHVETNYAELKEEVFNEDPEMSEQPVEKLELMRRLEARKQDITQVNGETCECKFCLKERERLAKCSITS
jgi:hypothetical protein